MLEAELDADDTYEESFDLPTERPIAITWKLTHAMPIELFQSAAVAVS